MEIIMRNQSGRFRYSALFSAQGVLFLGGAAYMYSQGRVGVALALAGIGFLGLSIAALPAEVFETELGSLLRLPVRLGPLTDAFGLTGLLCLVGAWLI